MKRIVRLTESDIRNMINEAIKGLSLNTINEANSGLGLTTVANNWAKSVNKYGMDNRETKKWEGLLINAFEQIAPYQIKLGIGQENGKHNPTTAYKNALRAAKNGNAETFTYKDEDGNEHVYSMDNAEKDENGNYVKDSFGQYIPVNYEDEIKGNEQSTVYGGIDFKNEIPQEGDSADMARVKRDFVNWIQDSNVARADRSSGKDLYYQGRKKIDPNHVDTHDIYLSWYSDTDIKGNFTEMKQHFIDVYNKNGGSVIDMLNSMKKSIKRYTTFYYKANEDSMYVTDGYGVTDGRVDNFTGENTHDDIDIDNGPTSEDYENGFNGREEGNDMVANDEYEEEGNTEYGDENVFYDEENTDNARNADDNDTTRNADDNDASRMQTNNLFGFLNFMNSHSEQFGFNNTQKAIIESMIKAYNELHYNPEKGADIRKNGFAPFVYYNYFPKNENGKPMISDKAFQNGWRSIQEKISILIRRYGEKFNLAESRRSKMETIVKTIVNETLNRMIKNKLI